MIALCVIHLTDSVLDHHRFILLNDETALRDEDAVFELLVAVVTRLVMLLDLTCLAYLVAELLTSKVKCVTDPWSQ